MLDLLQILGLLLEVFVYCVLTVTAAAVVYAALQLWFEKRHARDAGHSSHPSRLIP